MKAKEELENLINKSQLFSIDGSRDTELFATEERRFINDLAELMKATRKDFAEVGLEIIQTAKACIKAYKPDCGNFLNYFNSSLKKTVHVAKAKQIIEQKRNGFTLDEKTDQTIRQLIKYAKAKGDDIYSRNFAKKASEALNISFQKVEEAIAINEGIAIRVKNAINQDGEKSEIFDFIAAKIDTPEEAATKENSIRVIVEAMDMEFRKQQERTKPLLKKLLTIRLIEAIDEIKFFEKILSGITFLDSEVCSQYKLHGSIPKAREIAEANGKSEESASRTLKIFLEKFRENVKLDNELNYINIVRNDYDKI
jgi:hypothetical protein